MQLEQRFCINHPDRRAIGICVETKKPICGECSTRYNGVNYSKEGLELMHERRRREATARGTGVGWIKLFFVGVFMSGVSFLLYWLFGNFLIGWLGS